MIFTVLPKQQAESTKHSFQQWYIFRFSSENNILFNNLNSLNLCYDYHLCKNLFRLTLGGKCRFFGQVFITGVHLLLLLFPLADFTHIVMYKLNSGTLRVSGLFLESPENVSDLYKSYFMVAVFAFKIKVSITLKMIQWKYQVTK